MGTESIEPRPLGDRVICTPEAKLLLQLGNQLVLFLSGAYGWLRRLSQPSRCFANRICCRQECRPEDGIPIARFKLHEIMYERIEQQRRSQHPGGARVFAKQDGQSREGKNRENPGGNRVAKAAEIREPELQKAPPRQRSKRAGI